MNHTTTVIIGAGQCGLAMSKHLADRSIDHVLIERGEVANSWRTERWDSLRLLTPNWQSRLPGYAYSGDEPHGYMNMREVTEFLSGYATTIAAPVQTHTNVKSVMRSGDGYIVETDRGVWSCDKLVLANGACNVASVPAIASELPADIASLTPMQYRNPDQLEDGKVMVVGASATGVQLAREIQLSGRQVTLCAGEHVRAPRRYRGKDIKWWMDAIGVLDTHFREIDDLDRARRVPSLQLAGSAQGFDFDLGSLQAQGVRVVGRLAALRENRAFFSGSLANQCALADLKMRRLLRSIDEWIEVQGEQGLYDSAEAIGPTLIDAETPLQLDLVADDVKTVIWATGYRPDYSWLHMPVFDRKGRIRHDGGVVVDQPGLYVLGLPFLRRRKSTLIDGAGADAGDLANHLSASLHSVAA